MNPETSASDAILFAYGLDGQGGGSSLSPSEAEVYAEQGSMVWVHLDYSKPSTRTWLSQHFKLAPIIIDALLADDPRPRCFSEEDGLLLILRGMNHNPQDETDDMVSIRMWMETNRIITLRHRKTMVANELANTLQKKHGPRDGSDFLVKLIRRLLDGMDTSVENIDEAVDELEERSLETLDTQIRSEIGQLRRTSIVLRRHFAPQRQTVSRLASEDLSWLSETARAHLREYSERLLRYIETLDSARERALVVQEELNTQIAERTNHTMYLISVCTAVFLPLGLLTGLLGINVGGMPGTDNAYAFWIVCLMLFLTTLIVIAFLKRSRWL